MARNGRIAGSDGQPLGSASEVQQHLAEIFPGIKFALQRAAATSGIQSLDLPGWLAKISGVKYPHWIGMSERERFIISFRLDGEQSIDAIHVAV